MANCADIFVYSRYRLLYAVSELKYTENLPVVYISQYLVRLVGECQAKDQVELALNNDWYDSVRFEPTNSCFTA